MMFKYGYSDEATCKLIGFQEKNIKLCNSILNVGKK